MLEKYEKDFDENEFMRSFMERKQISTKKQALAELRKLIKKVEDFLTDVYKNGYADGKESVPGVELQDVEKALQDVKGIGPVVWNRIKERLAELFRKEQP